MRSSLRREASSKSIGAWLALTSLVSLPLCVAEPAPLNNGPAAVLRVADFGASGDGESDDTPAIQRAIDAAIKIDGTVDVVLEAGKTYRLAARTADASALLIGKARGLTLSGHGATIVAHPANGVISVFDSRTVTIRDLTIDYDPLPFTQARLTEVLPDRAAVRFRIEPGYADPGVGGANIYPDFKNSDAVFLDGAARTFTHHWARIREIESLGPHAFEARFYGSPGMAPFRQPTVGDFIVIKRQFQAGKPARDAAGRFLAVPWANVYVAFSHDVRIERVTSHAAPSMTFVASGSEGVVLDGCRVIRKPHTDRLIAGNSDGAHFKSLTVMPQVHDCMFEALMDDSINIRISSEVVREVHGPRIRLVHGDIATDDIVVEPGQSLTFSRRTDNRYLGVGRVVAVDRIGYRDAWGTLESAIADLESNDLAFVQPTTEAVVSRCEFRSQLKTGLLVCPPAIVSDCLFSDLAYGIHAAFLGDIEGPPPGGLRVERCQFVHPAVAAIALYLPSPVAVPADRQALLAERCRITMANGRGWALEAANQAGIVLRDIGVIAKDGRARAELFHIQDCARVHEENVTFTPGP